VTPARRAINPATRQKKFAGVNAAGYNARHAIVSFGAWFHFVCYSVLALLGKHEAKKISSRDAAIPVRALDFMMYNTKNIRPRAFYQKLFGLKRGHEWNDFWSEFATEPLTVCLNGTGHERHAEWDWSGPACVALAVDDVRTATEVCRRRRVKILIEPVETRVCWMAASPTYSR
jgi:hypothetical protein